MLRMIMYWCYDTRLGEIDGRPRPSHNPQDSSSTAAVDVGEIEINTAGNNVRAPTHAPSLTNNRQVYTPQSHDASPLFHLCRCQATFLRLLYHITRLISLLLTYQALNRGVIRLHKWCSQYRVDFYTAGMTQQKR